MARHKTLPSFLHISEKQGLGYKAKKILVNLLLPVGRLTVQLQAKGLTKNTILRDIKSL